MVSVQVTVGVPVVRCGVSLWCALVPLQQHTPNFFAFEFHFVVGLEGPRGFTDACHHRRHVCVIVTNGRGPVAWSFLKSQDVF